MVFIETTLFTKLVYEHLSEEEYAGMQNYLLNHPKAGDVIRGSGGARKLRWASDGRGKRGGVRVIYYLKLAAKFLRPLTLYAKKDASTIAPHILKKIAEELQDG